jgi:two-component system phosphate regulon response regulator OmpR
MRNGKAHSPVILIVDDDAQIRALLRHFLAGEGYAVYESASVSATEEFLKKTEVHLVILDVFIPEEDGLEFIRESRRMERKFKILAMSGYAAPFLRIAAQFGANAVIAKPFNREELLLSVKNLLLRDEL